MNFKHKILGDKNYEKKLPNRTDKPIRIDEAKIVRKEKELGFNFDKIFGSVWAGIPPIVGKSDIITGNPYYEHPNIMSKYSDRKFQIPPRCPRCSGNHTVNYMGDYVTHNTMFHGADFSIVIKELEDILNEK